MRLDHVDKERERRAGVPAGESVDSKTRNVASVEDFFHVMYAQSTAQSSTP